MYYNASQCYVFSLLGNSGLFPWGELRTSPLRLPVCALCPRSTCGRCPGVFPFPAAGYKPRLVSVSRDILLPIRRPPDSEDVSVESKVITLSSGMGSVCVTLVAGGPSIVTLSSIFCVVDVVFVVVRCLQFPQRRGRLQASAPGARVRHLGMVRAAAAARDRPMRSGAHRRCVTRSQLCLDRLVCLVCLPRLS